MPINWEEVQKALYPVKDYADLCRRWQESFAYPFVRLTFNFTLPEVIDYTSQVLGGDTRGRYTEYSTKLIKTLKELHLAGISDLLDLIARVQSRVQLDLFTEQSNIQAEEIAVLLKYLIYWLIPNNKYLSGLIRDDPDMINAINILRNVDIRTNLDTLQEGITPAGRKSLAEKSGLPAAVIAELVNRADFSRMPWGSKATISNIIGAGYGSLALLVSTDPDQLSTDFIRYGKTIGKNLKLGNEIENSYRIAKVIPVLVQW